MPVPEDVDQARFAEALVVLPKGWPLKQADFQDERHCWPLRLIKNIARFPHHAGTWLGFSTSTA